MLNITPPPFCVKSAGGARSQGPLRPAIPDQPESKLFVCLLLCLSFVVFESFVACLFFIFLCDRNNTSQHDVYSCVCGDLQSSILADRAFSRKCNLKLIGLSNVSAEPVNAFIDFHVVNVNFAAPCLAYIIF